MRTGMPCTGVPLLTPKSRRCHACSPPPLLILETSSLSLLLHLLNPPEIHSQDVIQFQPMLATMGAQILTDPLSVPSLMAHVGPGPLAEWLGHMANLGAYTALHGAAGAAGLRAALAPGGAAAGLPARARFALGRLLDAWEYGSGKDYKL